MLTFVGLGLWDERDITLRGLDAVRGADVVFIERYTSILAGTTVERLEVTFGKPIRQLARSDVESSPEQIIGYARDSNVVLLAGGDPMVSTTHIDLRLRAAAAGVETRIVHGTSIATAICGATGLQNYRFGKSCSIPYPSAGWFPTTPAETVVQNLERGQHTLVYLDIREDRYMSIPEGIALLEEMALRRSESPPPVYVGVARAGAPDQHVAAGSGDRLKQIDFGPPLHILCVPAPLHVMEREYLEQFGGL
jgi:diphthine synthase